MDGILGFLRGHVVLPLLAQKRDLVDFELHDHSFNLPDVSVVVLALRDLLLEEL